MEVRQRTCSCLHSIDPWLHAASMMISITVHLHFNPLLQTHCYRVDHPTIRVSEHNRGYAHKFTPLFASDGAQLIQLINSVGSSDSANFVNLDVFQSIGTSVSSSVADILHYYLYYSHSSKLYNQSLSLIFIAPNLFKGSAHGINVVSFYLCAERVNRYSLYIA